MSGLFIRIKPDKKIMIQHNGEILTLMISVNKTYSELVCNFEGPKNFIIDREPVFLDKVGNYRLGNDAGIINEK
jgi:hypothetical protein